MHRALVAVASVAVGFLTIGADVQCTPTTAQDERPSLESLQWQIDILQAQLDASAGPLRMFDGAGNVLGIPSTSSHVFNEDIGLSIALSTLRGALVVSQSLWFEQPDCEGQAYSFVNTAPGRAPGGGRLLGPYPDLGVGFARFHVTSATEVMTIDVQSKLDGADENCISPVPAASQEDAVPAEPFTGELPFTMPVQEPLSVGLEAAN